ncbi:hypothetical protein H257_13332 [Aphanomyces astaci]|uniref:Pectate lyase n=1 Tax=Aphanomyces astaci TaxID=112090 RepID=W4FXC5_APHAT|nr:hypothetical protein H257_13332 [Aphanomyces astaci]ETV71454.1 hypothetical protein H257_13332 [Aphanomyces astaci]|eukprot:XP_009839119.1 hypothetical protein H257_13332 [Aphanomyces astaci]
MKCSTSVLLSALAISSVVDFADAHGRLISLPHRGYIVKMTKFPSTTTTTASVPAAPRGANTASAGTRNRVYASQHETGGSNGLFPSNSGVDINGQEQCWNCADVYISNTCGSDPAPANATAFTDPRTTSAVPPSTKAPSTPPRTTEAVVPTSTKSPFMNPQTTVEAPTYSQNPTQKPTQSPSTTTPTYPKHSPPHHATYLLYPTQPSKTTASPTNPTQAPSQCGQCSNCYYPLMARVLLVDCRPMRLGTSAQVVRIVGIEGAVVTIYASVTGV